MAAAGPAQVQKLGRRILATRASWKTPATLAQAERAGSNAPPSLSLDRHVILTQPSLVLAARVLWMAHAQRILIVDDEADFIQRVQNRLQVAGHEVEFATRSFEVINKALTVGQYLMLLRQRQRLRKSGALPVPVRNAGPPRFGVPASVGR